MGLRSFFKRRPAAAGETAVSTAIIDPAAPEPLTQEHLAELQEAWAEFAQAAEGTGLTSFHACSRNGKRWEEDPATVRALAATLRDIRAEDTPPGTQPAS
ncbi:hypothetical protein QFZ36_004238 [Pseudarthrobacter siccitolerans]|uniref:Uncharacterized protein n=1 Tax=Pseudarthrobacter siccitolerans TaxID=861266 RepID=A0ABU0PSA4_9MICC|nr:hypothetical protein [Pseudarthrobacter siccitolerans]MDQ0676612.1 hypothetical protein [Pseudarthrobacter siccitolerans]